MSRLEKELMPVFIDTRIYERAMRYFQDHRNMNFSDLIEKVLSQSEFWSEENSANFFAP